MALGLAALLRQQWVVPRAAPPPPSAALTPISSEPDIRPPAPKPSPPRPRAPMTPPTLNGMGLAEVRVVSAQDQRPLAGATVAIIRRPVHLDQPLESATTDEEGIARIPSATPGIFHLCARGAGHGEDCSLELGLVAGGSITAQLSLPPTPDDAAVIGTVFQPDGTPAQGVRLMAYSQGRMPLQSITDAQGRYRLEGVRPGSNDIHPF
ncbi:MSCRAMM family protein, partial [Corallococcus terminator]